MSNLPPHNGNPESPDPAAIVPPEATAGIGGLRRLWHAMRGQAQGESSDQLSDTGALAPILDASVAYPDDDEFIARIDSRGELLSSAPQVRQQIRHTIERRGDNPAADKAIYEACDAAFNIWQEQGFAEKSPLEAILDYVSFCLDVDVIKKQVTSQAAPTDRSNAIMNLMSDAIVRTISEDSLDEYITAATSITNRLASFPVVNARWATAKVKQMQYSLDLRKRLIEYSIDAPGRRAGVAPEKIAKDSADISQLFAIVLKERREYGVQLSYTESGADGSLVFSELDEFLSDEPGKNVHARVNGRGSVMAVVVHSNRQSFDRLRTGNTFTEQYNDTSGLSFVNTVELDPKLIFHLGQDGELYLDQRRQFPVRDAFVDRGHYDFYRKLQGEIITNFVDLTTAEHVADKVGVAGGLPKPTEIFTREGDPTDVMYDLVVPRLEMARVRPERTVPQEVEGMIRVHNVAYHRMRLRPGFKPSPQALALAATVNFPLPPGYTFVRAHKRGNPARGAVTGHKIRHRTANN